MDVTSRRRMAPPRRLAPSKSSMLEECLTVSKSSHRAVIRRNRNIDISRTCRATQVMSAPGETERVAGRTTTLNRAFDQFENREYSRHSHSERHFGQGRSGCRMNLNFCRTVRVRYWPIATIRARPLSSRFRVEADISRLNL